MNAASSETPLAAARPLIDYPPLGPAEDFATMMQQSADSLPQWCRDVWTDFNVHDPGIMILEQLLYALTELPYRATLPLPRLLAAADGRIPWDANSLYAPTEILPMRPLTAGDYARLLYDQIPHLVAAEIGPLVDPSRPPQPGQLQATLYFDPSVALDREHLRGLAEQLLAANSNLGERFDAVSLGEFSRFELEIAVELAPDAQPAIAIAQIHAAIQQALLPGPRFCTLAQALAAGMPIETALEGPLLQRGVLAHLPAPCSWLEAQERASAAVLAVPGVTRVLALSFTPLGSTDVPAYFCLIPAILPPSSAPLASTGGDATATPLGFRFARAASPAQPTSTETIGTPAASTTSAPTLLTSAIARRASSLIHAGSENPSVQFTRLLPKSEWPRPPAPPPADTPVGDYFSVQHQFPRQFRLEAHALPPDAPAADVVAVRQLKGYLLPFEQLMANYFAQLAHTADFFSNRPQQSTAFTQPLSDVPEALPLFAGAVESGAETPEQFWADIANPYVAGLAAIAEDRAEFSHRRQRVLDHLLARFNESFPTSDPTTFETIANKEQLLQSYRELGSTRALSAAALANLRAAPRAQRPMSGLERKVRLLLRRDLQRPPPDLAALDTPAQRERPDDFYFVFEPIRFFPPQWSETIVGQTDDYTQADFGPWLFHVLINWTFRPLTPSFQLYAQDLVLANAPAHLWHRFIWIDPLTPPPNRQLTTEVFLPLAQAWFEAGSPPLDANRGPLSTATHLDIVARAGTPAARLFAWLHSVAPSS